MKLSIYNKEKWPITANDVVFVPFCHFEESDNEPMSLDGDFCATTDREARDHWWFKDYPTTSSVKKMIARDYIQNYVVNRSDMNPFWTVIRLEMLKNNTHLFDNANKTELSNYEQ